MKVSYRSLVVVALLLTTSCDSPTGVRPDPDSIVQPDDVVVVLKLRVIPSQEDRSRLHFNGLQIRRSDGKIFPVSSDGQVTIKRSEHVESAVYHLETREGIPQFFKEATTLPVSLAGEEYWDVLPLDYVVPDGSFAGRSGPARVKENCELHSGEFGVRQDLTFYPALFCEDKPAVSMPIVYKFPIKLHYDQGSILESEWMYTWGKVKEHMREFGGVAEWFALGGNAVKVFMDSTPGPCTAGPRVVIAGEVIGGEWRCPFTPTEHFPGTPRNHLLNLSSSHEIVHLLGLGHKCDGPTHMSAPGCNRPDGHNGIHPTWPEYYTLQDIVDIRVWLESQVLANSSKKSNLGLKEILRAERSELLN